MQATERQLDEAIGKYYPTATIWVSRGRYTYTTSDLRATGHFTEPDERKFRRQLALELRTLNQRGYFVKVQQTTIEG
ncbi:MULTISPECIES: hypothetical protein [Pseudanabaena]|uniref:Uncharacterized protein n=2 Tax=Pseudanabaena TaxID=1152 RepID=L8N3G7_9CYAN|nr:MULTISPECIES: hypothetical protein [Pseudanabaena]ELS32798.1 hypothetical protein Pse7429DRAFT_2003 [Pseudanabaena biceps PCC 7429]MDG3494985.1 hypothetical protein [Pseudanabaena catenata USMAC16]